MLTDLTNRRRVLHLQIEQLRAGRERLSETIQGARQSVDDIADGLLRAEDDARLAAEAAGRSAAGMPDHQDDEVLPVVSEGVEGEGGESPSAEPSAVSVISDAPFDAASVIGEPMPLQTPEKVAHPIADEVPGESEIETSATESSGDNGNGIGRDRQVEDLFARLRASSVGDGPGSSDATDSGGPETAGGPSITSEASEAGPALSTIAESTDTATADSDDEPTLELGRPLELVRRDELLGPVIAGLARRVKRALQDDQNDILDRLRSQGGWKDGVLARPLRAHGPLCPGLEGDVGGGCSGRMPPSPACRSNVAEDVGSRGGQALPHASWGLCVAGSKTTARRSTRQTTLHWSSTSGAAFREWRGDRTERLAGDHATAAFAVGSVAATSTET